MFGSSSKYQMSEVWARSVRTKPETPKNRFARSTVTFLTPERVNARAVIQQTLAGKQKALRDEQPSNRESGKIAILQPDSNATLSNSLQFRKQPTETVSIDEGMQISFVETVFHRKRRSADLRIETRKTRPSMTTSFLGNSRSFRWKE
jgi:hypothetical protein